MEVENLNIYDEEVRGVLRRSPPWIVENGGVVILSVLCMLLIIMCFIRFPEVIVAPVEITGTNPPVKIVAQSSGRMTQIFKNKSEIVKKNEIIGIVENPTDYRDMLYMQRIVQQLEESTKLERTLNGIKLRKDLQLGTMQSEYAVLYQKIQEYIFLTNSTFFRDRAKILEEQSSLNQEERKIIFQQADILSEQLALEKWKDSINGNFFKDKVIARLDYNIVKEAMLAKKILTNSNNVTAINNKKQEKELRRGLIESEQQYFTQKMDLEFSIINIVKGLRGAILSWEKLYLMRSPIAGKLNMYHVWQVNQYVRSGETIFIVEPEGRSFLIRAQLPIYKSGKVKVGQKALIKLQEFPYDEFGMLEAKITELTSTPLDSSYTVLLTLNNGFKSTRNVNIPVHQQMIGVVEFITEDKKVLERIFEKIYGKVH